MKAVVTYSEMGDLIEKRFKVRPEFVTVDAKTVEVSYKPGALMPAIKVKFHIETMRMDRIVLTYDCSAPAALMISGAVKYLEEKIPDGVQINAAEKRISIFLLHFEKIEKALRLVDSMDVSFEADGACVALQLA